MKYIKYSLPFLCFVFKFYADPVITMFFQPYPNNKAICKALKKPGKIAQYHLEKMCRYTPVVGIFSTYGGYLNASDAFGQTTFPRKHAQDEIKLVITNKITPVIMFANTVHHWELQPGNPVQIFSLKRITDENTGLTYWNALEIEKPEDNTIPIESLVILAKPKNMYFPQGISIANNTPNLILPIVYVKKGINIIKNSLYILNISQYFGPTDILYKKEANRYSSLPKG